MTSDRWFYAIWIPVCVIAAGLFLASATYLASAITS